MSQSTTAMVSRLAATVLLSLTLASTAWAQSGEGGAEDGKADGGAATTFGGGVIVKDRLPMGDAKDFKDAGYDVISDGKGGEVVVVDVLGKIYKDRNYHGIIPGIRDAFNLDRFAKMNAKHKVCWVGFQPMAAMSRVFWQLTHSAPRYEVTKVDNQTIEVFFPGGRIDKRNNRRYIYTDKFVGPVSWIRGKNRRKKANRGAAYQISLRADAKHTHRFAAPFLFLDLQ